MKCSFGRCHPFRRQLADKILCVSFLSSSAAVLFFRWVRIGNVPKFLQVKSQLIMKTSPVIVLENISSHILLALSPSSKGRLNKYLRLPRVLSGILMMWDLWCYWCKCILDVRRFSCGTVQARFRVRFGSPTHPTQDPDFRWETKTKGQSSSINSMISRCQTYPKQIAHATWYSISDINLQAFLSVH